MNRLSRSFYIAVGLLFGCAGGDPSRREFRDGAPMRATPAEPRTTFTPNGAGLPEYWGQPQAEALPKSQSKRVLPPAKEPGIWASDTPSHPTIQQLFGFSYPVHQEGVPKAAHVEEACARKVATKLEAHKVAKDKRIKDPRLLQCLAAKLWVGCVQPNSSEGNQIDEGWDRTRLLFASVSVVDKNCPSDLLDKHGGVIQELVIEITRTWRE